MAVKMPSELGKQDWPNMPSGRQRRCGRLSARPTAGVRRPPDAPARRAPGHRRGKLLSGACIPRRRDGFHQARARHRGTVRWTRVVGAERRVVPRGPAGKHRHHVPLSRQPVAHRLQQDDFAEEAAEDSRDRGVSACIEPAYQRRDVVAGHGMHFRGQVGQWPRLAGLGYRCAGGARSQRGQPVRCPSPGRSPRAGRGCWCKDRIWFANIQLVGGAARGCLRRPGRPVPPMGGTG